MAVVVQLQIALAVQGEKVPIFPRCCALHTRPLARRRRRVIPHRRNISLPVSSLVELISQSGCRNKIELKPKTSRSQTVGRGNTSARRMLCAGFEIRSHTGKVAMAHSHSQTRPWAVWQVHIALHMAEYVRR